MTRKNTQHFYTSIIEMLVRKSWTTVFTDLSNFSNFHSKTVGGTKGEEGTSDKIKFLRGGVVENTLCHKRLIKRQNDLMKGAMNY